MAEKAFWKSFIRAAEAEPRDVSSIKGVSGLEHPTLGFGVDEKRQRVVIISADHDARSAAMMQADIQATFPGVSVVVARPALVSLPNLANALIRAVGAQSVSITELAKSLPAKEDMDRVLGPYLEPAKMAFQAAPLNMAAQAMQIIQQLALIEFKVSHVEEGAEADDLTIGFQKLAETDPTKLDRALGICPVPLYDMNERDIEALSSGSNLDDAKEVLTRHEVIQYFFPPPDQAALGLIDRGVFNPTQVSQIVSTAPVLGHPLGPSEIASVRADLVDVIEALEHAGYVTEGEFAVAITEPGKEARATVKYKPREGLISKLLNRLNINIDPTKLGGG